MAKVNKNSLRLDADFTEDTVGFALESFLSLLSFPRLRFSIEPFSRGKERWLGADARLNGHIKDFKPFYMQFKRPTAYPDHSKAKVIVERTKLGLPVSPRTLYFDLRKKQESHFDFQHNILFRLRRRLIAKGLGDATYVCPLFLERSTYRFHVHMAGLNRWFKFWLLDPWDLKEILMHRKDGSLDFSQIPVLREHVSIPPHDLLADANHSYSFTEQGSDICFHSPLKLPEGSISLANFLTNLVGNIEGDGFISIADASSQIKSLFEQNDNESSLLPEDWQLGDDGLEAWLRWGDYLKNEFQIEQFAIIRWEN